MQRLVYKHYLLCILTLIFASSAVDHMAVALLMQDIKVDFALTDMQLGFLAGMVPALLYAMMLVPIARCADRGDRVLVISSTALVWCSASASCGLAATFVQLLFVRMFVAMASAGCVPPALSLIADYFDREERPRATAIYGFGGGVGAVVGYFFAGWLNELYGWRITFALLSVPGLMLATLAWFSLREPRRRRVEKPGLVTQPGLKHVCAVLWATRTFRHLLLCQTVLYFFGSAIQQWRAAFFVRSFGLGTDEIGMWFAITAGVGGLIGSYLGGEWAVRCAPRNEALQLRIMAIAIVGSSTTATLVYLSPNAYVSFGLVGLTAIGLGTTNGPLVATIQTLVPDDVRAVAFALVNLVVIVIGLGLGPLAAGTLSDALRPWAADESLRYALLILAPGYLWCAWHAWRASQTVGTDFAARDGCQLYSRASRLTA